MTTEPPPNPPAPPPFDPAATHMQRPKLRQIRGFPVPVQGPDGKQAVFIGLADAKQISDRPPLVISPAAKDLLPLFSGQHSLDEICTRVGRGLTRQHLEPLVAQLDAAGLLEGPTFDEILTKMRAQFDSSVVLPPGSTAALADMLVQQAIGQEATEEQKAEQGAARLAEALDKWIDEALKDQENPSFDALPLAIVAPHIDYLRGWINYARVWGRLRVVDRPERVIVLGTNHFGSGTGVVGCDKGFSSPLGECPVDAEVVAGLRQRLGEGLFRHRYDHEREHSIELQIPWIQHCLGGGTDGSFCKVFGALVHDPTVNGGESYDGKGVSLQAFVDAMREVLAELPGQTLVVASADLSHVGPMFGDKQTLGGDAPEAAAFRNRVLAQDREMLGYIEQNRPEDLVGSVAWQGNSTRWCSIGNLIATLRIVQPREVKLLNYAAAMDPQGVGLVSSAALVMR